MACSIHTALSNTLKKCVGRTFLQCHCRYEFIGGKFLQRKFSNQQIKDRLYSYINEPHYYYLASLEAFLPVGKGEYIAEPFNSGVWYFESGPSENEDDLLCIQSTDVFRKGYMSMKQYINGDPLDVHVKTAFETLERFMTMKDEQELRLERLLNPVKMSETDVMCILTKHLLAQLLPIPSNYYLNSCFKKIPERCPCGCGEPIQYGLTRLGSPELFYGNVDTVLFPTLEDVFHSENSLSANFALQRKPRQSQSHDINNDWNSNEEYDDDDNLECERYELNESETLYHMCKQAISLSLCKQRQSQMNGQKNEGSILPLCGISRYTYSVTMYDAEHDYLLAMPQESPLFEKESSKLKFSSIVDLWLLINHNMFCTKPSQRILQNLAGTCRLRKQLGEDKFKSVLQLSRWLYQLDGGKKRTPLSKRSPVHISGNTQVKMDNHGALEKHGIRCHGQVSIPC